MKLRTRKDINKIRKVNAFLPVYINKSKLLDVNSILFNGYSEFSEETLETEKSQKGNAKSSIDTGLGFSIYKLNGSIEADISNENNNKRKISLKRVQTNSSLLSNTIDILNEYKLLRDNSEEKLKVGDFIQISGVFRNNSICDLLDQLSEIMSFAEFATKLDSKKNNKNDEFKGAKEQITKLKSALKKGYVIDYD